MRLFRRPPAPPPPDAEPSEGSLRAWAVCANVSDHLRGGQAADRFYQGTPVFAPGTKVYVGRLYRGVGATGRVIGKGRGVPGFVGAVLRLGVLANVRLAPLYAPALYTKLRRRDAQLFAANAEGRAAAQALASEVAALADAWRPEKLGGAYRTR